MKSRIWQLAGVGLLCVSVSAQTLAEGPNSQEEQRGNQHGPQGQQNHPQPQQQQNHPQPQQPPQQQQQQQRPVQQSGQYQFHQQNFNRDEPARQQQNFNRPEPQRQPQQPPVQQQQPRPQQQSGQYQFHQQDFPRAQDPNNRNQFDNRPAQNFEQPSIRPKPDEVRQTQPPIRGNYADMPNRDRRDDRRWPGRPDGHGNGWGPGPQYRPGQFVDRFPGQSYRVPYRGGDYFFSGGYWYRPEGPRYIVVSPPYGIRTRYLPDYAREVWVGGALFFLAAGSYYQWLDSSQEYQVVNPPTAQPEPAPNPYDVNLYPAYGQSPEQMAQDKYECYRQAVQQTGFDPATATYAPEEAVVYAYHNAFGSCLSTRGYRVY